MRADDGPLLDLTSGFMWLAASLAGVAALALPGTSHAHLPWALGLAAFAAAWGVASLWLGARTITMPLGARALVTAAMMPIVAVALWATGGAASQLQPALFFTALFIGYFFPPRHAWPLAALFVAAYASPLLYDGRAVDQGYPGRTALFLVGAAGAVIAVQILKRRLVRAEAHQRAMAERDPLTGLHNRRSFDCALARTARACALVLFDFNGFKAVNDVHGHPAGDAVLRAVAGACAAAVRDGDCLARIGGDEFALVAPGAGPEGARGSSPRSATPWTARRCPTASIRCGRASPGRWRRPTAPTPPRCCAVPTSACSRASAPPGCSAPRREPRDRV
jgi:hypothetical protein